MLFFYQWTASRSILTALCAININWEQNNYEK